jgi:hypothetical protein
LTLKDCGSKGCVKCTYLVTDFVEEKRWVMCELVCGTKFIRFLVNCYGVSKKLIPFIILRPANVVLRLENFENPMSAFCKKHDLNGDSDLMLFSDLPLHI